LVVGFTGYQALQARDALNDARRGVEGLREALTQGNAEQADEALATVQEASASARWNTRGPIWWLASQLPAVGNDVGAVRTVSEVADDIAQDVLPDVVAAGEGVSPASFQPTEGRVGLAGIAAAVPHLRDARDALDPSVARALALDPESLTDQIAEPVRELQAQLMDVEDGLDAAVTAAQLLPPMLGENERRTYLILFQNNAEIRATGGIPGAMALVSADDGRIELERQVGTAAFLGSFAKPVLPLTEQERALFGELLAVFPADINFTPDFPRTAELAQAMWRKRTGQTVDGVVSADPIALSYLLAGTGPVRLSGGRTLTAANAVEFLLNEVYLEVAPEQQDALFADAARAGFEAVAAGQGDPGTVLDGLLRASEEGRLLVWSDRDEEQVLLADRLAGELPTESGSTPNVGVYFNDGTGAKMDYYLDYDVDVESIACDVTQSQELQVTVTMTSTAPEDAASLPESVIGPGFGAPPGWIRTNVLVYAPRGGVIEDRLIDGEELVSASLEHQGRPVALQTIDLKPGQAHELAFDVVTGEGQPDEVDLRVTPGIPGNTSTSVGPSACSR